MTRSGSCWLIKFAPCENMDEERSFFFDEYFDVVAVNYTDDGLEQYVGYKGPDFVEHDLREKAAAAGIELPPFQTEFLESKNWLKENVIKFAPFEIGAFMVYGIHEAACPPTEKIPVQVYAATAFGSEHQTTKMCLSLISRLYEDFPTPKKILDMGTGSGILSVAAAQIWHQTPQIIAADIDAEAVDVAASNAVTNGVEKNIAAILSDGYANPAIAAAAPYDLIFANILANPLREMSAAAYANLRPGGCYLISGFIDNQENDIIEHHLQTDFKLLQTCRIENWRAALLQK